MTSTTTLENYIQELKDPNIAIIGLTGSGKSSLVNSVFGKDLAKTGAGRPITKGFVKYEDLNSSSEDANVTLYDSAGYEVGKESTFVESFSEFIDEKKYAGIENQIHLVWFVVSCGFLRFTDFDVQIISRIQAREIPIIIVLSKIDLAKDQELFDLRKTIQGFSLGEIDLCEIAAEPLPYSPFENEYGVKELVNRSYNLLPDLYIDSFVARQIIDISLKRKTAWKYVYIAASTAFSSGFVPLPAATPIISGSAQTALFFAIARLYGFYDYARILTLSAAASFSSIFNNIITALLDAIGASLPPTFPVVATMAGASAATYTTITGAAAIKTLEGAAMEYASSEASRDEIEAFLKKTFREEFNRYHKEIKVTSKDDIKKVGRDIFGEETNDEIEEDRKIDSE